MEIKSKHKALSRWRDTTCYQLSMTYVAGQQVGNKSWKGRPVFAASFVDNYYLTMNEKKGGRLRKKKDYDDDEDFGDVPLLKSASAPVKRLQPIKRDSRKTQLLPKIEPVEEFLQPSPVEVQDPYTKRVTLEPLNKDKIFIDILSQANNPEFLMLLRNLLSGCNHTLDSKKNQFKKKWSQLRNSSCSREEYIKKEQDVKKMEEEEIREIKEDVISRLGYSKTKGFESKEQIIEASKEANPGYRSYELDEAEYYKRKTEQFELLEMLMKEQDLVIEPLGGKVMREINFNPKPKPEELQKEVRGGETQKILDSEENPETVQFLFSKQFSSINYERLFESPLQTFQVRPSDQFLMSKKSISWLLDSKSDEIYSNEKFQVATFEKYSSLLKSIYENNSNKMESISQKTREELLEISTYILNSIHYSQKFKLKCPILHPLDILYVIEKIKAPR